MYTIDNLHHSLCGSNWGREIVRSVGTLPPLQSWHHQWSSALSQSVHSSHKPTVL